MCKINHLNTNYNLLLQWFQPINDTVILFAITPKQRFFYKQLIEFDSIFFNSLGIIFLVHNRLRTVAVGKGSDFL